MDPSDQSNPQSCPSNERLNFWVRRFEAAERAFRDGTYESVPFDSFHFIRVDGPLETPELIQKLAQMDEPPKEVVLDTIEDGRTVRLCCVGNGGKANITRWIRETGLYALAPHWHVTYEGERKAVFAPLRLKAKSKPSTYGACGLCYCALA
jgi:hypothetical protein